MADIAEIDEKAKKFREWMANSFLPNYSIDTLGNDEDDYAREEAKDYDSLVEMLDSENFKCFAGKVKF